MAMWIELAGQTCCAVCWLPVTFDGATHICAGSANRIAVSKAMRPERPTCPICYRPSGEKHRCPSWRYVRGMGR